MSVGEVVFVAVVLGLAGGAEVLVCVVLGREAGADVSVGEDSASLLFGRRVSGSPSLTASTVGCMERESDWL